MAELIDDALIAGARIEDEDVDSAAAINPIKIETRPIYIPLIFNNFQYTGSPSQPINSPFSGIRMRNAGADTIMMAAKAPRGEIAPGQIVKLHVFWVGGSSGILRLVADIKPIISGTPNLASALQRTMLRETTGSSSLTQTTFEFPSAIFSKAQLIGVQLSRDPANTLDTMGADADIYNAYLEMVGRC